MIGNKVSQDFLQQLFSSVDVESAKAKEPADQQAILQIIRKYGVSDVNTVILGNLKQWMVQGGDLALKSVGEDSEEAAKICAARGIIHSVLGEYDLALEWAEKALNICIRVYGPEHQEVATAYTCKAASLKILGRLDEALVANEQASSIYTKLLGVDHPDTIISRIWKAEILKTQGKLEEALVIYSEVLQQLQPNVVAQINAANIKDENVLKLISAQCIQNLHGFIRAFPSSQQEAEQQLSQQTTLDAQAKWLLSKPSQTIIQLQQQKKPCIVIENVANTDLAHALSVVVQQMSTKLSVVIVIIKSASTTESVLRPLNDFAIYDWEKKEMKIQEIATTTEQSTTLTTTIVNNLEKEYDAVISYHPDHGQDVARSLALGLVKFGSLQIIMYGLIKIVKHQQHKHV
jgi:tetratricopeptide (TPR) repeat protein